MAAIITQLHVFIYIKAAVSLFWPQSFLFCSFLCGYTKKQQQLPTVIKFLPRLIKKKKLALIWLREPSIKRPMTKRTLSGLAVTNLWAADRKAALKVNNENVLRKTKKISVRIPRIFGWMFVRNGWKDSCDKRGPKKGKQHREGRRWKTEGKMTD